MSNTELWDAKKRLIRQGNKFVSEQLFIIINSLKPPVKLVDTAKSATLV